MVENEWKSYVMNQINDVKNLLEKTVESQVDLNVTLKSYISKQNEVNKNSVEKHEDLQKRVKALEQIQAECPGRRSSAVNNRVLAVLGTIFGILGVVYGVWKTLI